MKLVIVIFVELTNLSNPITNSTMKITLLTPALTAILGLALASTPMTVQAKTKSDTPPAPSALTFNGPIMAIDTTAKTITVQSTPTPPPSAAAAETSKKSKKKSKGPTPQSLLLTVNGSTKITKDGAASTLDDFKVGDKVSGTYSVETSGSLTATTLTYTTPAAPPTKKSPKSSKTPKKSSSSSDSSSTPPADSGGSGN